MWAPRFAFDQAESLDESDDDTLRPVTAHGMLKGAAVVGLAAGAVFVVVPGLDLAVARMFYVGDGRFLGSELSLIPLVRTSFNIFFYSMSALTVVGLIMAARTTRPWLELNFRKWLFIALCLIAGPLVVANIGFKDHWGRARPRDVVEFDGSKAFSAPFPPSGQCDYNCSFVSGEASSIFILMFALALLSKSRSRNFVATGIVLGGLCGLVRMANGAHFLSDVVFAGVLMAATAAATKLLFETLEAGHARTADPATA